MIHQTEIRRKIVAEARTWLGTPYHLNSRIKGVGCDCATLILQTMINVGVFTEERMEIYSDDWWQHTEEEKYSMVVLRHAKKILETVCYRSVKALPGQIVLGRVNGTGRLNHGAIITEFPMAIHSVAPVAVEVNLSTDPMWAYHPIEIYDPLKLEE